MSQNHWNSNHRGYSNNHRGYSNHRDDSNNRNSSRGNWNRNNNHYRSNQNNHSNYSNYQGRYNSNNNNSNNIHNNHYGPANSSPGDFTHYRDRSTRDRYDANQEPNHDRKNRPTIPSENHSNNHQVVTATSSNESSKPKLEDMSYDERVKLQLKSAHYDFDKIPEVRHHPDKEKVNKQKKDACQNAIKQVMLKMKHDLNVDESEDDDDDDDDSKASDFSMYSDGYDDDGPYSNKRRKCELKYSTKEVSLFFNSLIKNEVFDMGFRVWGLCPDDDTNCWCPCGKHMVAWRECVVVEHLAGKGCDAYCNATSKMTPLGLMGHLEKKGEICPLHYGISVYLTERYKNLRGTGHKGLYKMGDKKYKEAEAAEKREAQQLLMKAIKDKEAAEKKFQESEQSKKKLEQEKEEWMKKLKEISPDLADKVKDLEDGFKRLNLNSAENELEEKDFITYDEDKMKWYDALLEDKILSLQCGLQLPNVKSWDGNVKDFEKGRVTVDVNLKLGESFDINKIFTTLEKKNQAFFKCDNVSDMTKFLFPMQYWAVRFSAINHKNNAASRNKDRAVDAGGPTKQFFSSIWTNLESLCLSYGSSDSLIEIKLFQTEKAGLIPTPDDLIDYQISRIINNSMKSYDYETILNRVKKYYKVVGIILFRAIICAIPIASHVMPTFYRNVLLRNVEPKDEGKYSKRQMLAQFADIGMKFVKQDEQAREEVFLKSATDVIGKSLKSLRDQHIIDDFGDEDEDTVIDLDSFFTVVLQANVKNQSIAISALKEGLTLDGTVNTQLTLASTSLSYVSEKLFAAPVVDPSDLFQRLVLSKKNHGDLHQPILDSIMEEIITEMTPEEREGFVFFCTGFNYLPRRDSKFLITVEFDYDKEKVAPLSLPVSHTCENTISFPSGVYGKDKMIFKAKLFQAISNSKGFSMV